jgi:hypothetical protein
MREYIEIGTRAILYLLKQMNKAKEINISLFYHSSGWDKLLSLCLGPFLTEQQKSKMLSSFLIYLNTNRGDNIQLTLHPKKESLVECLTMRVHTLCFNYFSTHPSAIVETSYLTNSIFMNFENNSIRYNIFRYGGLHYMSDEINSRVSKYMSRYIIEMLATEEIDFSRCFLFAFYLIVCLASAFTNEIKLSKKALKSLVFPRLWSGKETQINADNFTEANYTRLFEQNKTVFKDIINNCGTDGNGQMTWLAEWKTICKFIAGYERFEIAYVKCVRNICNHLNLSTGSDIFMVEILCKAVEYADTK